MKDFTNTLHCRSRVHCRTCRDPGGTGRATRAAWGKVFALPGGDIDFPCPHGVAWGLSETPSRGLGDTVEKIIKRVTLGRLKPCRGCRKRRDWLNRKVPYRA